MAGSVPGTPAVTSPRVTPKFCSTVSKQHKAAQQVYVLAIDLCHRTAHHFGDTQPELTQPRTHAELSLSSCFMLGLSILWRSCHHLPVTHFHTTHHTCKISFHRVTGPLQNSTVTVCCNSDNPEPIGWEEHLQEEPAHGLGLLAAGARHKDKCIQAAGWTVSIGFVCSIMYHAICPSSPSTDLSHQL